MRRGTLLVVVLALCALTAWGQVYIRSANLWKMLLTQNCESLILLFKDGSLVIITENDERRVSLPWDVVFKDRLVKDLVVVIHNHLGIDRWSIADRSMYHRLRGEGFVGLFLCRLGSGKIIEMEDRRWQISASRN